MPLLPRENIAGLEVCKHGGLDYGEMERLNISSDGVIDFSSNLNPKGPPPGIRSLVRGIQLSRCPDSQSTSLRRMIARKTGLSIESVIVGSGSTELIRLAATAYLGEAERALVIEPTYGEYRIACEIAGAKIVAQALLAKNGFEPDVGAAIKLVKDTRPKVIFICNPNNPTGGYLNRSQFQKILESVPDSLVILDEAYISFVSHPWSSVELIDKGNLLIVRSMTKDYSLAGLRLGYALASKKIIGVLSRVCPPWNVNVVAQHAGIVAMQQERYLRNSCELAFSGRQYLIEELEKLGFSCLPSRAHFFLVAVGNAAELRRQLLGKGILVRDCASFGLPEYVRIAPGTLKKNRRLVAALREIVDER